MGDGAGVWQPLPAPAPPLTDFGLSKQQTQGPGPGGGGGRIRVPSRLPPAPAPTRAARVYIDFRQPRFPASFSHGRPPARNRLVGFVSFFFFFVTPARCWLTPVRVSRLVTRL